MALRINGWTTNKFKVLHIKIENHSIILSNRQISVMEFVCFSKSIGRQIEMEKPSREAFEGNNKLLIGIVLSVITFWLFAQSLVNVVPILEDSFNTDIGTVNIAVSITALFSGMFVVGAGGLADKYGRIKLTNIGIILNILGSLLIIISNIPLLLIIGRLIQGLSAACIMPATLSIIKSYYIGKDRQRALSYWSIGSWGGSGVCSFLEVQLQRF